MSTTSIHFFKTETDELHLNSGAGSKYLFDWDKAGELIGKLPPIRQVEHLKSRRGTVHGMTFYSKVYRLLRVVDGLTQVILVDLRPDSDTFSKSFGYVMTHNDAHNLWVPAGVACGVYGVTYYSQLTAYLCKGRLPKHPQVLRYDDPQLDLKWACLPDIPTPTIYEYPAKSLAELQASGELRPLELLG